jgi:hypothetical protein
MIGCGGGVVLIRVSRLQSVRARWLAEWLDSRQRPLGTVKPAPAASWDLGSVGDCAADHPHWRGKGRRPTYLMFALFAWLISHQPTVLFSQNKPATSNQPEPASSTLLSEQTSTSHQPTDGNKRPDRSCDQETFCR